MRFQSFQTGSKENPDPDKKPAGPAWGDDWDMGYRLLFLCEYYMVTRDQEILPSIEKRALLLARGQGMYGTFGHGFAALTKDGTFNGLVPPYGPVNMAGLPANLAIVLARKYGVKHPEIDQAIARAAGFFGYFTDKGAIPYGEHEPVPYHENNGKNSITAVTFAQGDTFRQPPQDICTSAAPWNRGWPGKRHRHRPGHVSSRPGRSAPPPAPFVPPPERQDRCFRPWIPIGDGYCIGCASGEARWVTAVPGPPSLTSLGCDRTGWGSGQAAAEADGSCRAVPRQPVAGEQE